MCTRLKGLRRLWLVTCKYRRTQHCVLLTRAYFLCAGESLIRLGQPQFEAARSEQESAATATIVSIPSFPADWGSDSENDLYGIAGNGASVPTTPPLVPQPPSSLTPLSVAQPSGLPTNTRIPVPKQLAQSTQYKQPPMTVETLKSVKLWPVVPEPPRGQC